MSRVLANNGIADFDAVRLAVASPEDILKWSHGEVTKPVTIVPKNQSVTVYSANEFSDQSKISTRTTTS
jgi:hypothetical protein